MSLLTKTYRPAILYRYSRPSSTEPVVTTSTVIEGSFQPIGGNEQFKQGKGGETATDRFYTSGTTVAEYGNKVEQDGVVYVVLYSSQHNGISGRGHHKEFICGRFA